MHVLFSWLPFRYQYQQSWLPGKIHLRNDLLLVEREPYQLTNEAERLLKELNKTQTRQTLNPNTQIMV